MNEAHEKLEVLRGKKGLLGVKDQLAMLKTQMSQEKVAGFLIEDIVLLERAMAFCSNMICNEFGQGEIGLNDLVKNELTPKDFHN